MGKKLGEILKNHKNLIEKLIMEIRREITWNPPKIIEFGKILHKMREILEKFGTSKFFKKIQASQNFSPVY